MLATLLVLLCGVEFVSAQGPAAHYRNHSDMSPGAIGRSQLQRGGPLPGYFQPIEIRPPEGVQVAFAANGAFEPIQGGSQQAGLLIGSVYRLRVTNIPLQPGREVYPSIELLDRTYPPAGQAWRFAIPIEITVRDLELALSGKMVTRVVYLEDPRSALPVRREESANWFEAAPGDDPLRMADTLGRPVAIVRLGARVPDHVTGADSHFLYGNPPLVKSPVAGVPQQQPAIAPLTPNTARHIPRQTLPAMPVATDPRTSGLRIR